MDLNDEVLKREGLQNSAGRFPSYGASGSIVSVLI
jgi:hypothetical protein